MKIDECCAVIDVLAVVPGDTMTRLNKNLEAGKTVKLIKTSNSINQDKPMLMTHLTPTNKSTMLHVLTLLMECKGTFIINLKTSNPNI